MAEATIAPEVVEFTITGTSPARSAWLWSRALLHKARMGIVHGATKVKVTMTNALGSTAAAALAAGTQIALATRSGWNAGAKVLTKAIGVVAKGALLVAKAASWVMDKIGKFAGWFAGLFNKGWGQQIQESNARFTAWREAKIMGGRARVEIAQQYAYAAMTTQGVSTTGRIAAGAMGVATIANLATSGMVAAHAATLPVIGPLSGLAFGPIGLLVTGGIALLGGLFSFLFKREAVQGRLIEIEAEAQAKLMKDVAEGELTVHLSDDGKGGTKVRISGHPVIVRTITEDPVLMAEVAEAAMKAEAAEAGITTPPATAAPTAKGRPAHRGTNKAAATA